MTESYENFLADRANIGADTGFEPHLLPEFLFDFQRAFVKWAVRKGRAAIFADCGLGKTPMQLAWAENVLRETGKPVLIITPLAVSRQLSSEGQKFGIPVSRVDGGSGHSGIVTCNYQRLHKFTSPDDYGGIVLDESSILKSFSGETRKAVTEFMRRIPYRLLCTATAAPNDHTELGTSSEALGYLGHVDMLSKFFRANGNQSVRTRAYGSQPKFRFVGHGELPFWRWVASWARAARSPSDLGFDDSDFILPPLTENDHIVHARKAPENYLFPVEAVNWQEQRAQRRYTIQERCERAAELVEAHESSIIWCHLNDEGDLLEQLVPNAVQVAGKHSDEIKAERLHAFATGEIKRLITKPKIGAWGLNLQRCAHVVTFASHSYEQYYQSIRRRWRYGQDRPVLVDIVISEGEQNVLANLRRKARAVDRMFTALVKEMSAALHVDTRKFNRKVEFPQW